MAKRSSPVQRFRGAVAGLTVATAVAFACAAVAASANGAVVLSFRDVDTGYAVAPMVVVQSVDPDCRPGPVVDTFDAGGEAIVKWYATGRYTIRVTMPGYVPLDSWFTVDDAATPSIRFMLSRMDTVRDAQLARALPTTAVASGFVTDDATGAPLAGVAVALESADVETVTDAAGYFALRVAAPVAAPEDGSTPRAKADVLSFALAGYKTLRRTGVLFTAGATIRTTIALFSGEGAIEERHDIGSLSVHARVDVSASQWLQPPAMAQQHGAMELGTVARAALIFPASPPSSIRLGVSNTNGPCCSDCPNVQVYTLADYVRLGLGDEWLPSWEPHSLRAGAVAYRSYGAYHVSHPRTSTYDICSSSCCQAFDNDDEGLTSARTAGIVLLDPSLQIARAEYSAENNNLVAPDNASNCATGEAPCCTNSDASCGDGFAGSPAAGWPCLSDVAGAGQYCNGHGRGMSQWGSQGWAAQGKSWLWIVNHYYNDNGTPAQLRAAELSSPMFIMELILPTSAIAGIPITIKAKVYSAAGIAHEHVLLGAYVTLPTGSVIQDHAHDTTVVVAPGESEVSRLLLVPSWVSGPVRVNVSLWLDVDEDGRIDENVDLLLAGVAPPTRTPTPTVSSAISPTPTRTPSPSVSPSTVTPARTVRVSGVVTNAATRARLAGAVMTLAGQTTTTDSNGQYDFTAVDLTAGRTLSAMKAGFSTYSSDLTVPVGAVAVAQDIALSPSGGSKPIVTAVKPQYQGLFLGGAQVFNQYAASVNWNGAPGTVEFYANGTLSQVVPGTPSGASAGINMALGFSGSLSLGVNQLRVIAVNGAGVRSDAFTVPVSIIPLPGFLSEFAALAPFQFIPGNDPQYSFTFEFPDQSAQFLQSLPLLDKTGIDFSVEGGFEYALNSGEWEIHFGTLARPRFNGAATRNLRRPKLSVGDLEVDIGLSAVADGIATQTRGIVPQDVGLQLTLDRTQDIKSFLLSDYVPGAQWLRILDWLKRLGLDINSLQRVTLQGLLKLALQLVAQLDPPPTGFGGFRTPIDLGARAVYGPDLKAAQGLVKVGGTVGTTLQRPQDPFLQELRAQFFGEVQFTVLSLVVLDEQFAILNYTKDFTAAQALRSRDGAAKDWRVIEGMRRPVRPIARDYLSGGPPRFVANQQAARLSRFQTMSRSRRRDALAVSPTTDMVLVENVFSNGQPALAARGSELMVLYVSDNATANPVQFTDINWMRYDGATWTAPQPILADTRGEFSPQVAFDGNGNAVAVWERIKDPNLNTTDVTALLSNVEIVWSRWDRATGTWSLPASLTNNAYLDHYPRLPGPLADGSVLLAWTANTQNRIVGDSSAGSASTDTVRWAKWDPNLQGWSIPQTLVSNLTSRTSQSLAAGGTAAVYAWTTDADGNLDDASDQEVIYSTWTGSGWAAAAQLTNDTVADRNLRAVIAPSGKVFLVWQRGADLVLDRDLASAPEVAHAGTDSIAFTDYALSVGPAENLALMWENQSPDGSDPYYKVYDPASGRWSQDDRLLADSALERSFAPAWDDAGNLTVAYDRTAVNSGSETITTDGGESITIDNVPQLGRTDLAVLKRALVKDVGLQAGDFTAQGTNFLAGDSITLSATVRNLGNLPVESLQVAFYDGAPLSGGTEIGRQVIAGFPRWCGHHDSDSGMDRACICWTAYAVRRCRS
ncbi:MAG: hypothetical protein HY699_10090 [Deltaproteobacteria bacterium]|nr:hypothetical protein [Deltaproteobacteria bacterium]